MSLFSPREFTVLCPDPELLSSVLSFLHPSRRSPPDSLETTTAILDSHEYLIFFDPNASPASLLISFSSTADPPTSPRLSLHVCLGIPAPPRVSDLSVVFSYDALTPDVLSSVFSYAVLLNDCFPFGLHLRRPLSQLTVRCLRRVFRSLDSDFDSRVSFSDLSDFHSRIFGHYLSLSDVLSVFRIMNDADARHPSQVLAATFSFQQFVDFAQFLVNQGDGPIVFRLIECASFHHFLSAENPYLFEGTPPREMGEKIQRFVRGLYEELDEAPSRTDVIGLFGMQGEPPTRISNMRSLEMSEWIRVWCDWWATEPGQAARNLLAFGFPLDQIDEALGVETKTGGLPVATIGGLGLAAVAVSIAAMVFGRWGRR
jgi:hypothetical protein